MDVGPRANAKILILAGTSEATELAGVLTSKGFDVISSLAGITASPTLRAGAVRSGGFGGADGLTTYLRDEQVRVIVDATHPFAAVMPFHVAAAADRADIPRCRLLRDPWRPQPGDRWIEAPDLEAAAITVASGASRVFLAVGRNSVRPFAQHVGPWFLVRTIEPMDDPLPNSLAICDRGPFTFERELSLLNEHRIDTIVTKNAGGQATIAKLEAARSLGLTVVMVQRPRSPQGTTVPSVAAAAEWVDEQVHA